MLIASSTFHIPPLHTGEDGLTSRRSEMRLEALEDDLLARHQKKLRFKQLEDQLNEENQLILDLIKLYGCWVFRKNSPTCSKDKQ